MSDKVNPTYRKMIEQIAIDNEDYTDIEMKGIYSGQKSKLDELHSLIGLLFVKYSVDGLLKLSTAQKSTIKADIESKLKAIGKSLGQSEVNKVTSILSTVYQESFYKNAYVMDSGMKVNLKFNLLKKEFIDAAVNQEFKGELFSDRIWKNKADMIDKLQSSITECMKGNTTIDKIGRDIQNTFNVQAYESRRLVHTEMTRIQAQAQNDIAINTGVKQHMWSATLESNTCAECAALDGQIFNIDDDSSPQMPLHPEDRCTWINIPFADWQPTKRKDNESKTIIDYTDYENWKINKDIS